MTVISLTPEQQTLCQQQTAALKEGFERRLIEQRFPEPTGVVGTILRLPVIGSLTRLNREAQKEHLLLNIFL